MNATAIPFVTQSWRQALLDNRQQTLERIYAHAYPMVAHYVKEHGGTADDAKDVFQEAMLVFYEKVVHDQLTLTASVSTYLMGICKNLWYQELEKRGRKTSFPTIETDIACETPAEETEHSSLKLMDFVNQLGDKCKDVLVSFYYFGQRLEQIARRHGHANIRTATVQKFKCLERLRKAVSHLSVERFN
jgi:RNA polymerase sigma factor (sigma-70 family)